MRNAIIFENYSAIHILEEPADGITDACLAALIAFAVSLFDMTWPIDCLINQFTSGKNFRCFLWL